MRTKITPSDYPNRCTLRYDDEYGNTIERDFFAPAQGGYVRENWTNPRQVCGNLAHMGATLTWYPTPRTPTLADLIRRERRAAMRRKD